MTGLLFRTRQFLLVSLCALLPLIGHAASQGESRPALRVCADPNNMPFSTSKREGFENRIIELIAESLRMNVQYSWWAQRRGYVRNTLGDARCDVWPGVATGVDAVDVSVPYYRSTYTFVTRADRPLGHLTFDDPRLRDLSIGVQLIGDDANNTPPTHAVARRGLIQNVRGYPVYGDYDSPNPAAAIVRDVSSGAIDVAIVWGPPAGYFSSHESKSLRVEPVSPRLDDALWPMTYEISMGVRKGNDKLLARLNAALLERREEITQVLEEFGVPIIP